MRNQVIIPALLTSLLLAATVYAEDVQMNPEAAYQSARNLAHDGNYQQAIDIYTRLLHDHPDNPDYLLGAGQTYIWQGRPAAAIPLLEKGIKTAPGYEDIYRALAQAYNNNGQLQKAKSIYRKAMAQFNEPDWAAQGLEENRLSNRPVLSLQLSNRLESLSNNSNDWRDTAFSARVRYENGSQYNLSYVNSERFGLIDGTLAAETYLPVGENDTVYGELRYSNSHRVLPEYSIHLQWNHALPGSWGITGGYKRINYTESGVHLVDLGAEYYFSNYRVAYTSYISDSDTAGIAVSHRFQLGYTFNSMSNIQLAVATGSEVEKPVNASSIIKTDFTTLSLWGEAVLNRQWSFIYAAGYTDLTVNTTSNSNRKFFNLGIRYTY